MGIHVLVSVDYRICNWQQVNIYFAPKRNNPCSASYEKVFFPPLITAAFLFVSHTRLYARHQEFPAGRQTKWIVIILIGNLIVQWGK
jgi:hypothetical protein